MPIHRERRRRAKCWTGLHGALLLESGDLFYGCGFGAEGLRVGDVVFTTAMVGYHEALTDPSYRGQILVFTHPLIGNYGVPSYRDLDPETGLPRYFESESIKVEGTVIAYLTEPSHRLARKSLDEWLREEGVPGVFGVDTRAITKILRERGVMRGVIAVSRDEIDVEEMLRALEKSTSYDSIDFVKDVAPQSPVIHESPRGGGRWVAVIDCGVKLGIVRALLRRGFSVVRVPPWMDPGRVMSSYGVAGFVVSNGPGNPSLLDYAIKTVQAVLEYRVPVLGICLGNQLIALACGCSVYKLRYGHRGHNKPCIDLETGICYMTSQNHGYAVSRECLEEAGLRLWFINADDGSVEGLKHSRLPAIATQFHPEACPGPLDTEWVFDVFAKMVSRYGDSS